MNPNVDFYFEKPGAWQREIGHLRTIALDCGLGEELKWGVPCYTHEGGKIVLIHVFKEYCALLFFKGALLTDPAGLLVQQTENTQATRQLRFTGLHQIRNEESIIRAYIREAIELEKSGIRVPLKTTAEYSIPEELQQQLDALPALKTAFEALTPGRQRAYLLHFAAPKLAKTRAARVEKSIPMILDGKGLND